jgi:flagellar motor protein MotB
MVVRIFAELYGVPLSHLSATGFADAKPLVSNDTSEGRTKNRRVEILILEKTATEDTLDVLLPKEGSLAHFPR